MVLDETSVAIQGFEDRYTEYSIRLNSVTVDNGTATAEVGIRRFGESAYVDYPAVTIRVNGRSVSYSGEVPGPRDGFYPTDTVSFDAAPGDTI